MSEIEELERKARELRRKLAGLPPDSPLDPNRKMRRQTIASQLARVERNLLDRRQLKLWT